MSSSSSPLLSSPPPPPAVAAGVLCPPPPFPLCLLALAGIAGAVLLPTPHTPRTMERLARGREGGAAGGEDSGALIGIRELIGKQGSE